jgi:hypothetical protein
MIAKQIIWVDCKQKILSLNRVLTLVVASALIVAIAFSSTVPAGTVVQFWLNVVVKNGAGQEDPALIKDTVKGSEYWLGYGCLMRETIT